MIVRDVWHALLLAAKNFAYVGVLFAVGLFLLIGQYDEDASDAEVFNTAIDTVLFTLPGLLLIQSIVIYRANSKYEINVENNSFIFPRSDIENSIFQILIGARYWNLMRTKSVALSEIDNIYIDTKRWQTKTRTRVGSYKDGRAKHGTVTRKNVRFRINVTGSFGGANLSFLHRQKRDEVRSALQAAVSETTGKKIDRKVSEFS